MVAVRLGAAGYGPLSSRPPVPVTACPVFHAGLMPSPQLLDAASDPYSEAVGPGWGRLSPSWPRDFFFRFVCVHAASDLNRVWPNRRPLVDRKLTAYPTYTKATRELTHTRYTWLCTSFRAACARVLDTRRGCRRGLHTSEDQLERADTGSWQIADRHYTAS